MSQLTVFEHDTYPAEQFDDPRQQSYAATLGMWAFLATEVLFIGAIFVCFFVYRLRWSDAFAEGARELKWYLGSLNTAVLLGSSYAMALAVHAARSDEPRALLRRLLITIALGATFLVIKGIEYGTEYRERLIPGLNYADVSPDGTPRPAPVKLFMSFYFVLTGVHALHMTAGLTILSVLAVMAWRRRFSAAYHNPLEVGGLYWHFVDLVWIFVLPTLYLLRHP